MLRAARPDLSIGFFLHIPFPSSEVYRLLPSRGSVLRGLLGADYVSFQSADDARHFRSACLRVLGLDSAPDSIEVDGRSVGIGIDPIGIDTAAFRETQSVTPPPRAELEELEDRFRATARSCWASSVSTTRRGSSRSCARSSGSSSETPSARERRRCCRCSCRRGSRAPSTSLSATRSSGWSSGINGRFGRPGITPVEYLHRSISRAELVAFYRRADVDARHVAARRDEPRGAGVRLLPGGRGPPAPLERGACSSPSSPAPRTCSRARCSSTRGTSAGSPRSSRRRSRSSPTSGGAGWRRWPTACRSSTAVAGRAASSSGSTGTRGVAGAHRPRRCSRPSHDAALARARRPRAPAHAAARLRRHAARARSAPGARGAHAGDLRLLRDLAALPATEVHLVSGRDRDSLERWFGDAAGVALRRARLRHRVRRASPGSSSSTSTSPGCRGSSACYAGRGRGAGHARRAEGGERHLALPPGGAGVRQLAREGAAASRSSSCFRASRPRSSSGTAWSRCAHGASARGCT